MISRKLEEINHSFRFAKLPEVRKHNVKHEPTGLTSYRAGQNLAHAQLQWLGHQIVNAIWGGFAKMQCLRAELLCNCVEGTRQEKRLHLSWLRLDENMYLRAFWHHWMRVNGSVRRGG